MSKYILCIFYTIIAIIFLGIFYIRYTATIQDYDDEKAVYQTANFAMSAVAGKMEGKLSGRNDLNTYTDTFFRALSLTAPEEDFSQYIGAMIYYTDTHIYVWDSDVWYMYVRRTDISKELYENIPIEYRDYVSLDWCLLYSEGFYVLIPSLPVNEHLHNCKRPYTGFVALE